MMDEIIHAPGHEPRAVGRGRGGILDRGMGEHGGGRKPRAGERVGEITGGCRQPGELVEGRRRGRVALADRLFQDGERALQQRRGLAGAALLLLDQSEAVERLRHIGVLRPKRLLAYGERAGEEPLRLGPAALVAVEKNGDY